MRNFEQYDSRKQALLKAYQTVLDSDLLPVDLTGAAQVNERRQDLEDERFLVAVCGRIKAGKSTLLNALLFRDWVMPTDDMPHTAKNTLVEYGLHEALEVTFFSRIEWDALTTQLRGSAARMRDEFFLEVAQAEQHGVLESDWIKTLPRIERYDSVAGLLQFVTPVGKGGIYTPFVKAVKVLHPHPWLRLVTIADTPGVDDPYKFREDQTKRFVTRAHAVLFVTYAGQAMSQPDFDFLNDYLIHVPQDRRLIAVNKADTLKRGSADVDAYLAGLMDSPEPAVRNVFGKRDSVCMVSALGGLISQAEQAGREVPEDYVFYRDSLAATGFLNPENNGIDALRLKVEERLVARQGAGIIDSHVLFLGSLFERKQRQVKAELTLNQSRLDDLSQTQEQLLAQIAEIEADIETMAVALDAGTKALERDNRKHLDTLGRAFNMAYMGTIDATRVELSRETRIEVMGQSAGWIFVTCFEAEKKKLEDALQKCIDAIEARFKKFADDLRATWSRWSSAASLDDSLSYSAFDAMNSLRSMGRKIAATEQLDKLREESTIFYQRWFNTSTGRAKAASAIVESLNQQLQTGMENKFNDVRMQLTEDLRLQICRIGEQLKLVQQGRIRDKEKLSNGHHDRNVERAKLLCDIESIHALLGTLQQLEKDVSGSMAR